MRLKYETHLTHLSLFRGKNTDFWQEIFHVNWELCSTDRLSTLTFAKTNKLCVFVQEIAAFSLNSTAGLNANVTEILIDNLGQLIQIFLWLWDLRVGCPDKSCAEDIVARTNLLNHKAAM